MFSVYYVVIVGMGMGIGMGKGKVVNGVYSEVFLLVCYDGKGLKVVEKG